MKYTEFGIENDKTLMIFPGGGVYWNPAAMPFVETASKHFHLIVVAYDGFNGDEKDAVISDDVLENSYEHEGNCAAAYIKEHFNGKIDVMYGCSAGAWMLLETLNHNGITADTVIVDGMPPKSYPKWWAGSISNIIAGVIYKSVTNPKFAERVTGQKWEDIEKKICTWVTKDAWKHFCKADCGYKIKYAAFRKADMHIWFGDKGTYDRSFRKISEKQIPAGVCYQMKVVKNCGHGGLFSEPKRMLKAIMPAGNHEKRYVI